MFDLLYKALGIISIGVIILDEEHKIVFFNNAVEKLCNIPEKKALGKKLGDVCPVFKAKEYQAIIDAVFKTGQSRFCSSAIHKSFVFAEGETRDSRRQNMKAEYISISEKAYVVIQIIDMTDSHNNEVMLQNRILQLKRGYDDLNFSKKVTEKLAKYDVLTGLLNRFYFEIKYKEMVSEIAEGKEKIAILFIDLDGFKVVNDTHGHIVGDALLQLVAARMKNNIIKSDILMRMGGDEFVVAMKDNIYGKSVERYVNNLLVVLRKPYYIDDKAITITASIGVSIYPDDSKHLGDLINKADKTMYASKKSGKNTALLYKQLKK